MTTHVCFADTRTPVEQENLSLALILYEVGGPGMVHSLGRLGGGELLDESLDHVLALGGHNESVDGPHIRLWRHAVSNVELF